MTGVIALNETRDGVAKVGTVVEDSSGVFASATVHFLEHKTESEVDGVVEDGGRVGEKVRREVENVAVEDEVIGEIGELFPVVSDDLGHVGQAESVEGRVRRSGEDARGVGSGRGTKVGRGVGGSEAVAVPEVGIRTVKEVGNVATTEFCCGGGERCWCCRRDLERPAVDADRACDATLLAPLPVATPYTSPEARAHLVLSLTS